MPMPRRFLVTGGCGFLGSNVAREVRERGGSLAVLDNLSRTGSRRNLEWLLSSGPLDFVEADVRDAAAVEALVRRVRPDVVFHLAGQVAMTTSIENPRLDFEVNVLGTVNVLEAVRRECPAAAVLYSSTNKVYGDLEAYPLEERPTRWVAPGMEHGFDESVPLSFHSPYGCSKGAADQYVLDYARIYGLRTAVFRHSSICGDRQFATYDQGWVGWFVKEALSRAAGSASPVTVSGDGKQVRDVLFAPDAVACYFAAAERIDAVRGEAFNIGGGMENSLSLLELLGMLERLVGVGLEVEHLPWRTSDQKVFVADIRKAGRLLGWAPSLPCAEGVARMVEWTRANG